MATPAAVLSVLVTANTSQANAALARTQTQLTSTAATANKATAATTRSTGRMSAAMATAARYGALALGAALVVSVKRAAEFEDQMMKVHTQAGASRAEMEELSKQVLEYARTQSEANPIELAKGLFRIESAGYRGAKAMEMLAAAERLADVGASDLEDTAKALAGAMRSNIKGTQNLEDTIGTLNAIVGAGSMTMGELVAAMGTGFLTNARQMGVTLKQAGAALAVLTEQNQSATSSATRLSMAFRMMMAPTDAASSALESIGLSATKLGTMMQAGQFPQALALLSEKLNALGDSPEALQKKAAVIREVFGARSSAGINALLVALDQYGAKLKQISDESGKFAEKEKADNDTLASQWNRLKATMDSWAISVGNAVKGPLTDLLRFINGMTVVIAKVVGWLAKFDFSLIDAGKAAARLISRIGSAFGKLPGVIKAALGGIAGLLISPFRLGAAKVEAILNALKQAFRSVATVAVNAFNAIRDPVVNAAKAVAGAVWGIVRAVAKAIQKLAALKDIPADAWDKAKGWAEDASSQGIIDIVTKQKGGLIGRRVPGTGSGDKVPALLEPGEVVWNRKAVTAMGGARKANAINQAVPRFAGGGIAGTVGGLGATAAWPLAMDALRSALKSAPQALMGPGRANWGAIGKFASQFGLTMTSGFRPGDADSWHGVGRARDYAGAAGAMLRFAQALAKSLGPRLLELIHTPLGFSIDNGRRTAPFAQSSHYDHVHVAMQQGGIAPPARNGKPHASWRKLFGSTFDKNELTTLAKFVGMRNPALMAAIAMGESSGIPGRVGDGGDSIGLWQINKPSWGGTNAALSNPITNAQYAKRVLRSQGLGAWTIYNTGAYREHLGGKVIQSALQALRGTGGAAGAEGEDKGIPTPMKLLRRLYKQLLPSTLKILTTSVHTAKQHQKRAKKTKSVQDDIAAFQELQGALRQRKDFTAKNKAWLKAKETGKGMRAALQAVVEMMQALQPKPGDSDVADALEDENLAELNALLKQQALTAQQRLLVSQAQYKTLQSTPFVAPYVGPFKGGGVVPGVGAKLATVHGGETITPKGGATTVILIEDGAVDARRIRTLSGAEAQRALRRSARRGNRPLPSRGGGI